MNINVRKTNMKIKIIEEKQLIVHIPEEKTHNIAEHCMQKIAYLWIYIEQSG